MQDSETSSADSDSGRPGSRASVPLMWVYSSRNPVHAVHLQGQVGDLDFGEQLVHLAAQGDERGGFGVGVQRGEHDLVAAVAGFDTQVGVGGIPGGGAPPRRVQGGGELVDDRGGLGVERQVLTQRVALVGPSRRG